MWTIDIYCPFCRKEFEFPAHKDGHCPLCGQLFWQEETFDSEHENSWLEVYWETYP